MSAITWEEAEQEAGCNVVARNYGYYEPPEPWCVTHNCDASPCEAAEAKMDELEAQAKLEESEEGR